jgi:hypothetical protein
VEALQNICIIPANDLILFFSTAGIKLQEPGITRNQPRDARLGRYRFITGHPGIGSTFQNIPPISSLLHDLQFILSVAAIAAFPLLLAQRVYLDKPIVCLSPTGLTLITGYAHLGIAGKDIAPVGGGLHTSELVTAACAIQALPWLAGYLRGCLQTEQPSYY